LCLSEKSIKKPIKGIVLGKRLERWLPRKSEASCSNDCT
jgi:hypothetical protein